MNRAKVSPDGYIAQRLHRSVNGKGHWLLTSDRKGARLLLEVFDDDSVADWPELVTTTAPADVIAAARGIHEVTIGAAGNPGTADAQALRAVLEYLIHQEAW